MNAKQSLDKIIIKARVHLYKPIQIAEILYRDRIFKDIDLSNLDTYRTVSRKWRDLVCIRFLGRTSSSSARYQDDVFNDNAIPPKILVELGKINRQRNGIVEAYIYRKFQERYKQMSSGLDYCQQHDKNSFSIKEFLSVFWNEPGLRRSIDKIYEIIVYALFSAIIEALDISVSVSLNPERIDIINEFEEFASKILKLSSEQPTLNIKARFNRVGVTNASDRGLDMWANFGLAIQIKHLSLTEELAENIVSSVTSDRIVIVCKDSEEKLILSLLTQIGWKSKIQSIITERDLVRWYDKALKGTHSNLVGSLLLKSIQEEIKIEFPVTENNEFDSFFKERRYHELEQDF